MSTLPLKIDVLKTSKENIVSLLNHTYPAILGVLTMDTYNFTAVANTTVPGTNTKLTITATEASEVQGTIDKYYNRVDITQPRIELEVGQTVESYLTDVKKILYSVDNLNVTDHPSVADVKVVTAKVPSLLYIGKLELKVFVPPAPTLEDKLSGEAANGFGLI